MNNSLRIDKILLDVDLKTGGIAIKTEGYTSVDDYDFINIVVANNVPEANYACFTRSRGTIAEPKSLLHNDEIFSLFYAGYDTENLPCWTAEMTVGTEGVIKPGVVPSYFAFKTVDSEGCANIAFSIHSDKVVGFHRDSVLTQHDIGEIEKYLKVKVGGRYYAIPLFSVLT